SDAQAAHELGTSVGASFKLNGSAGMFALDLHGVTEVAKDGSLLSTFNQLGSAQLVVTGRVDARDGRALAEAVGLDRLVSVDDREGRLDFKTSGRVDGAMATTARVMAGGLDISISGTLQAAQGQDVIADLALSVAQANVRIPQTGTLPTSLKAHLNY